jgi:hypothetical protein
MTGDNAEKDASSKLFPPADRARVEVAVTEQNVPLGGANISSMQSASCMACSLSAALCIQSAAASLL